MKKSIRTAVILIRVEVLILSLALCGCSHPMKSQTIPGQEVVGRNDHSFSLSRTNQEHQIELAITGTINLQDKAQLVFDEVSMIKNPDGVYEVYLSASPRPTKELSPDDPDFVTVLDLYQLSAGAELKTLSVNVTKNLHRLRSGLKTLTISIVFRGNKFSTNELSQDAGETSFGEVRLVQ